MARRLDIGAPFPEIPANKNTLGQMKTMHCKIEIIMDNAAFDPANLELARILRDAARRAEILDFIHGQDSWPLRDINGNKVGQVIIQED